MEKFLGVNWKTTLAGMPPFLIGSVQVLAGAAALFHIAIPGVSVTADPMTLIQTGFPAICMGLVGFLAKDKDVTGGVRQQ